MKFTSSLKLKLIYVFRINDDAHLDCLKIGEATSDNENIFGVEPNSKALNRAAKKRIDQYTQTAGIAYELLYTELAIYSEGGILKAFSDSEVHNVLLRSGIKRKAFDTKHKANEWFITDVETVKKAIAAVKAGKDSLGTSEITVDKNPILFRPEQKEAIEKTVKQFKKGNEMLWFAKMRFGKTLSALQVVKLHDFSRTLILTHRPVVDKGWFEDFQEIFYDLPKFCYGSKNQGGRFSTLEQDCKNGKSNYIYFASMQDLRGSELVGGSFLKNDEIFKTNWDLIIVDEAHEGTQTDLGRNVLSELRKLKTKILHLSGTPFNLLDHYTEEEIYTWDYVMEQKAKVEWDKIHLGDPNPYAFLPRLNIFTYDLGKLISKYIDEEVAFNFREFFRVNETGDFLHERDVFSFLNLICKPDSESNYPFSTKKYRDNFRHSLWMVPGVKEAKALSSMLKHHPVFSQFEIVNVAGDGDEEEAKEEALKKVEKAIGTRPHETYTITLSCGRLTTGVSVQAWTAVFMLSGSHSTSSSSYMQTIFRVQTPATINGRVKEECFVFDFAPDRTLKVIAETAKVSSKVGKTSDSDRYVMGEFLNFCPVISFDGSRMREYDVNGMLEQLKKVYIDGVVRNGFEDINLYNIDQLMQLDELEIEEFNGLKKIIGSTKSIPRSDEIEINKQGFTEEDYEKIEKAQSKPQKELTPEEIEVLNKYKEQKKMRNAAISILRGISIRMPLLIYGAEISNEETEISIDNFSDLVDDQSWFEFMPKGVTKELFSSFKKYYEPDVFRAAGKRIRALARSADNLTIEERIERITDIFGHFRNPDKETVLTPWRVVNMHLGDCLGGYVFLDDKSEKTVSQPYYISHGNVTEKVFDPESRILEINSKSGLYPLFIVYSIFRNRIKNKYPDKELNSLGVEHQLEMWDKTVAENVFVLCKTPMAKSITKRTLVGFREATVNAHYFDDMIRQITMRPEKFIAKIRKGKSYWKSNKDNAMKFDAIVGNPPYMEMDGGAQVSAKPLYNEFVDISKKIEPNYISLIIPTRWYAGGKGLDAFRESMLNDKRLAILHDFLDPEQVFPRTNIRGGICYFLWDKAYGEADALTEVVTHGQGEGITKVARSLKSGEMDIFIRHHAALNIINKVLGFTNFESLEKHVSSAKAFGFRTFFISDKRFRSNDSSLKIPIKCFGRGGAVGFVEKEEISSNQKWIELWKVYVPESNNIGTELNDDNQNSFVGAPKTICTETFLVIGANLELNKFSAKNLSQYLRSRFARFLHSIMKTSQHGTAKTYKFVPVQDFTQNSDIDWSKSIPEIDQQLYSKYGLNKDEIDFIESMIKPMKE